MNLKHHPTPPSPFGVLSYFKISVLDCLLGQRAASDWTVTVFIITDDF